MGLLIAAAATLSVSFAPCASPPGPSQTWLFNSTLSPASSAALCLAPAGCSAAAGAPLVALPCASVVQCSTWQYDTFTYFTFTNSASTLLMTSEGPGGVNATIEPGTSVNQQFTYNAYVPQISPASDSTLCLTAASS